MAAGIRKFILYLVRWQLSTPILYLAVKQLGVGFWSTVIANLIGGMIFFWVDKFIFTSKAIEMWHVKEGRCDNCGKKAHLWRLVLAPNYDKRNEKPIFLCMDCSKKKTDELRKKGIKIRGRSK
ncbi:MAG: hypothetical protein V1886_03520 [archaeon]